MKINPLLLALFILVLACSPRMVLAQDAVALNAVKPIAAEPASGSSLTKFPADYRIDPENVLLIDVYYGRGEKLSQQVRVSASGEINLPFIGDVAVAGLTVAELQKKLNKLFDKGESLPPQVSILVMEYSMAIIMGEVKKPGAYPIKNSLSVVELIALAEGFTESASANEVKVIHTNPGGAKTVNVVRVYDIMNKSSAGNDDSFLRSRDVVIVPKSTVTVIGEVMKPGIYPIRGRLTLIDLIAQAGGFTKFAVPNEVKVIHTEPDGKKAERVVPVYDMMKRGDTDDKDLLLYSEDVIFVR